MTQLNAVLYKESLLLLRDLHGLLLMFAMPVVFIIIMSLAMQNNFAALGGAKLEARVLDAADNNESARFMESLRQVEGLRVESADTGDQGSLAGAVARDELHFLLTVEPLEAEDEAGNRLNVDVLVAPSVNRQMETMVSAALTEILRSLKVERMLAELDDLAPGGGESLDQVAAVSLSVNYAYAERQEMAPTAVQQSVPAWLVFAMFFVVVPLSNTLIKERQFGTLRRLRTIAVSPAVLIAGKLLPYFLVMQLQVVAMLAVGVYLIPLLGGDRLQLGDSWVALWLMAVCVSIAALGYAVFISAVTRTTEQATTLGGAGNIILAALGGIMVPRFLMPEPMQQIGQISPMCWGLEGFLDVLLRQGGPEMVWPEALALVLFGLGLILMASTLMRAPR